MNRLLPPAVEKTPVSAEGLCLAYQGIAGGKHVSIVSMKIVVFIDSIRMTVKVLINLGHLEGGKVYDFDKEISIE